ncbi:HypC/HybG/HupF family hydrogenase formation chaperone [Oryzomicrobium sp.]|uniref:HypC/HybG/HupF family hydrogenase formation chaperone n=1 Tax=Oryzomicrobium sp. TaxID=1911578 RepID=UPI0025F718B8|nr:HypC/HybG/HupF family hydrogenase formation chaperone [Oryzomicrobium sp.]MCE1244889.1 HypC/HybG/HupF family hydrogenase formation chaperone [Oryzomicrobium sp.]
MCVGIPMRVLAVAPESAGEGERLLARCAPWPGDGSTGRETIDTLLLGPVEEGEWLLTFLGAARERISAAEAAQIAAALAALDVALQAAQDAASSGAPIDPAAFDAFFPDLANREPELPDHLKRP